MELYDFGLSVSLGEVVVGEHLVDDFLEMGEFSLLFTALLLGKYILLMHLTLQSANLLFIFYLHRYSLLCHL